jgi:hypothetical protein
LPPSEYRVVVKCRRIMRPLSLRRGRMRCDSGRASN